MTICPKCRYQRTAADNAPEWQCPSCGVAYCKATQHAAVDNTAVGRATMVRPDEQEKKNASGRIVATALVIGVLVILAFQMFGRSSSIKHGGAAVSAVSIHPVADPTVKPVEHNFEPQGFQGLPWGSDESAIVEIFGKDVVRLDNPKRYYKTRVDLVVPQYTVGGVLMEVNFQMDNDTGGLAGVLLARSADPHPGNPQRTFDKEHKELSALLTKTFGTGGMASGRTETKWTRGDATIVLDYFFQAGIDDLLTIHYTPRAN